MRHRSPRRALRRRYGRSGAGPEELFHSVEATFKEGREALRQGHRDEARKAALRVGELALAAHQRGLSPEKYGKALRAQRALIDALAA